MTPPSRDEARERLAERLAEADRHPGRTYVAVLPSDLRALLSPEQGWRDAVKVVSDLLEVWPKDSLPPHELCLRAAAVVNGTPAPPTEVGGSELLYLCQGLADDYMTSETHHPGYVLIPTAKFEAIQALLADQPHPTATPKSDEAIGDEPVVSLSVEVAGIINSVFLPANPNKMRSAHPDVIAAAHAFKLALAEAVEATLARKGGE